MATHSAIPGDLRFFYMVWYLEYSALGAPGAVAKFIVPLSRPLRRRKMNMPVNKSANTDPQLKAAASPLVLVVRLPLR